MQKAVARNGRWALVVLALLAGCMPGGAPMPDAPQSADLADEIVRLNRPGPPAKPEGACWESDVTPAVIETVTEQVVVTPEVRGADGLVMAPAAYRTDTQTRILRDREEVWFRAPCPADYTVDFVATLQRALKARGYYLLDLTGQLDAGTRDAVRRYQADRGLDSARLSLAAAEADITHVDMGMEPAQTATDLKFSITVRDRVHLAEVLRSLKRTPSVVKAQRLRPRGA